MNINFIDSVFFVYMFLGLYMLSLQLFLLIKNREKLFSYPKAKLEPVSIIVPCYNEAETIGRTIDSLSNLDLPAGVSIEIKM